MLYINPLELTRLVNGDLLSGLARVGTKSLNGLDNIEALGDLTEDNVLTIEPRSDNGGDEELGTVGVGTSVSHGEKTDLVVVLLEVLIGESSTVDRFATSTVVVGEVTTLEHELGDNTVERRTLVTKALLASAESAEVLSSLGNNVVVELELNATKRLAVSSNVEKDLVTKAGHGVREESLVGDRLDGRRADGGKHCGDLIVQR